MMWVSPILERHQNKDPGLQLLRSFSLQHLGSWVQGERHQAIVVWNPPTFFIYIYKKKWRLRGRKKKKRRQIVCLWWRGPRSYGGPAQHDVGHVINLRHPCLSLVQRPGTLISFELGPLRGSCTIKDMGPTKKSVILYPDFHHQAINTIKVSTSIQIPWITFNPFWILFKT